MTFEQGAALALFVASLFGIGLLAQHRRCPSRLWNHPVIYSLSFYGVSGVLFYYGAIEIIGRYGLAGLLGFFCFTLLFIFSPLFLEPLRWISQAQAFSSIPDLLVYRYRTPRVGRASTLVLAVATLPVAAAQMRSIADNLLLPDQHNNGEANLLMMGIGLVVVVFLAIFNSPPKLRRALPLTMAFGALLSLATLLLCGLVAVYGVFGGFGELNTWAQVGGQATIIQRFDNLYALTLVFFAAPFLLPQLSYMQTLGLWWPKNTFAPWMLPLILLVATLPLFPLLWAGLELQLDVPFQNYLTAIPFALGVPVLSPIVMVAGLFMAVGLLLVTAIALGKFTVTSFFTVRRENFADVDLMAWLTKWRFITASLWVVLATLFATQIKSLSVTDLTLAGMTGVVQLLPGLVGALYLPRVNHYGFLAGLTVGTTLWLLTVLAPLLTGVTDFTSELTGTLSLGPANWAFWLLESMVANLAVMLIVSKITPTSADEILHAHQTMVDSLPVPQRTSLDITSMDDIEYKLGLQIGTAAAREEVNQAIDTLKLDRHDTRPLALRMFRDQLSYNLSQKLGAYSTERLINRVMPLGDSSAVPVDDMSLLETRLANYGGALSGLAAELNKLRLYHRQTLENLPIGVCSIDKDGEILLWNHTLTLYTGITSRRMEGANLDELPQPWGNLFRSFVDSEDSSWPAVEVENSQSTLARGQWFHLHRYRVQEQSPAYAGNQILLIEDISERLRLIQELAHSERLTSVGRLAAGVAHEIGNPVTGISCLAQDLESTSQEPETRTTAAMILTQTERITRIVRTLIDFSRSDSTSEFGPVSIRKTVSDAIQLLTLDKSAKPVSFANQLDAELQVFGDHHQLTQVFVNLLANARDASAPHDPITVTGGKEGADSVVLNVCDSGTGIEPAIIERVLDPFFTTKDTGEGTGLGLSLVYSIIRLHGGGLEITSPRQDGPGTCVTVTLKAP